MSSYDQIYAVVRLIPYGQVATYGQIAELANLPGQARLVGYALFRAPDDDIPWHRVINAKGEISQSPWRMGNDDLQRSRLEAEGIEFTNDKVNLRQYRWQPQNSPAAELAIEQTWENSDRPFTDSPMEREVTDADGTTWTCVQAFSGLSQDEEHQDAAKVKGEDAYWVVCTPSGGAQSVRVKLPKDWEGLPDEKLLEAIEAAR
ncbi:MGMT family protein [Microcoleus sp. FACHB-1515]|uniref:MGMT family protein n=1 Tax=Microcoleus sp. FACHB-1515 TaxID=2692821 RepID=UPI001F5542A6|nr:MGMT family protein [Microcoleus sp. FACHB-1515]